jgi:predicted RNA binding protein YcfA (HicA-like mRNA interferase family)
LRKILRVSRKEKLIAKLKNNASDGNWTLDEVLALLSLFGFTKTGGRGSHQVFTSPDFDPAITLAPHGGKIKSGYIRQIRIVLNIE